MESQKFRLRVRFRGKTPVWRVLAKRNDGGEQIQFLRRHFGEAVEPQALKVEGRGARVESRTQRVGGDIEQAVRVLQFVFGQPVRVGFEQQRKVVELVAEVRGASRVRRDSARSLAGVN